MRFTSTRSARARAGRDALVAACAGLAVGAAAPATLDLDALALLSLDGERTTLAESLGEAPSGAIVLFWSLYQPDSRRALRALDQLVAEDALAVPVLTIEVPEYREGPGVVAEFVARAGIRVPVLFDPDGAVLRAVGALAGGNDRLPATWLIEPDGTVELLAARWLDAYPEIVRERMARRRPKEERR
jgi:hypothetical protein